MRLKLTRKISCFGVFHFLFVLPCFRDKGAVRCGLFLYVAVQVSSKGPQSVFFPVSYNILLFRGTAQQLEELFVAVLVGKPGVGNFYQWIWAKHHTSRLGLTSSTDKSIDRLSMCFCLLCKTKKGNCKLYLNQLQSEILCMCVCSLICYQSFPSS